MSVIAPDFKLSKFIQSLISDVVWAVLIISLIGLPLIMMVLFFIPMPVIDGELLTPFLAFTYLADPTRTLPIVQAFMTTDMFKIMAFPGFGFAALLAAATIFVERKMLAKLQLRVGPFYCGKFEGILQLMGDGLKLISKEIIIPAKADKPIFWAAPVLFVASAAAFVALIPVAPGWVVADVDMGLLGVFAVIGFFPIVTILSAWSANSKFPFIGGIRALFQMVSFEIPLILSLLGVVMVTGTLNLSEIAASQSSFPWIVFLPVGAIVFFITMLAELERIPFDLPEAESEIVAGWLTELSGMMYGLVQLGTYLKLYAFAALFVVLFLGGWNGPMIHQRVMFSRVLNRKSNSLKGTKSDEESLGSERAKLQKEIGFNLFSRKGFLVGFSALSALRFISESLVGTEENKEVYFVSTSRLSTI
jgi:NADH-quinone oxidoreductase subunit H